MIAARVRRSEALALAALAIVCCISVLPIAVSGEIPAFQQDWTWPLSRALSLQWLHAFAGLWDPRSLGQANPLPWQTYAVMAAVASVLVFGPSLGLAAWLAALEFFAGLSCALMARDFGVKSWPALLGAAVFYATGPVTFTRVAAGHLAYLLAYALLPLVVLLARRTAMRKDWRPAVWLGIVAGLSACQIQFLVLSWLIALPAALLARPSARWWLRFLGALGIAIATQLQALLPLAVSSAASSYLEQRALLSWEYNNSSPLASAPIMLGYFTHYYETAALPWSNVCLYVLGIAALAAALVYNRRTATLAAVAILIGTLFTAGLYGPLSVPLQWAFAQQPAFTAFRDLHYFAAFSALGIALSIALAIEFLRPAAFGLGALVLWACFPCIEGKALSGILVPRLIVTETLDDMRAIASHPPGRVLWLPAEEPLRLAGATNFGRDFTAYGPPGHPSVSDDLVNPQMAYALATLRFARPDWRAFAQMNVRYLVYRHDVRSAREEDNLGTGFRMAYGNVGDAQLGDELARDRALRLIARGPRTEVYELPAALGNDFMARVNPSAMLYSELGVRDVGIEAPSAFAAGSSLETADPRRDWVAGRFSWRYRKWLPDAIFPFVWTVSTRPLHVEALHPASCIFAAAQPFGVLQSEGTVTPVSGAWKRYWLPHSANAVVFTPTSGIAAFSRESCNERPSDASNAYVLTSGYDGGWRARYGSRWAAPVLANGWMMAWLRPAAPQQLVYLPSILQALGFVAGWTIVAIAGGMSAAERRRTDVATGETAVL